MNKAIKKLRHKVKRRWYLRFKDWDKQEAKRMSTWNCRCRAKQLIDDESISYKLDVILSDFTHDVSVKDLALLVSRDDDYLHKRLEEERSIFSKLQATAHKRILTLINSNETNYIKFVLDKLGNEIVQPDYRLK